MTRRLLVVDDEERIREVVRACLEDLIGWEVALADSGANALLQAKTEPIDAILLDLSMPDMNGMEILQQLQAEPQTQSIPVILLTGHVLGIDQINFAELGVAGVIEKPFAPIEIGQQIEQILGWEEG